MEPSRIHELNKIAGAFCGKKLTDEGGVWLHTTTLGGVPHYRKWDPADDHNDAAEVKAKLREKGYKYYMDNYDGPHEWEISDGVHYIKTGKHKDELIALLLAVEALMKEQKHA